MAVTGPNTQFKINGTQDLGNRYVSKDYLLDVYPNLLPSVRRGGLWAWGPNQLGQLGLNDRTHRSFPTQVGALSNWKTIEIAGDSVTSLTFANAATFAVTTDGALWAWGFNAHGQLGLGDRTHRSSPVQVGALTNWKQISGNFPIAAIKTDGTLWTWGHNSDGALGQNDRTHRSSPVQVGALTNWKQVSIGGSGVDPGAGEFPGGSGSSAAIKTDGTLWTWGLNSFGQLGLNDTNHRSSPVQVGALTNWKQVTTGTSCGVIKTDGTLWTWGLNSYGQLGQNDRTHRSSPVQVGALTDWKQISFNRSVFGAVKKNGTLWTWGGGSLFYRIYGALGLGDRSHRSSPTQVGTLTNWKFVRAGTYAVGAIKTDGTLWVWGINALGSHGNGNTSTNTSSPIQIGSLTNWKDIQFSASYAVAIADSNY